MDWLRNLPIKLKLIAMMTITTCFALAFMAVAVAINEALSERDAIHFELMTLAKIIGSRSTGALTFNDPTTAAENLQALQAKENIVYAAIFEDTGEIFAEYRSKSAGPVNELENQDDVNEQSQPLFATLFPGNIRVNKDILLEGERIGSINIISNMVGFYANLQNYLLWVGVIVLLCFVFSLGLAYGLHQFISQPVLDLHKVTNTISVGNDYSIRIQDERTDELGMLIKSFNHMLEQIEIRDQELARYSNHLEVQVADRTHELFEANQRRIQWLENMARFLKHELKNATVGIKTSLELMERRMTDNSIEVYLNRARKSLGFMNVLLDSVSNASSLEASVYKESLKVIDLSNLISSQLEEYRLIYADYKLICQFDNETTILGNSDRLKQMLDKLISNAIEHSKKDSPVVVNILKRDAFVELSVNNEGINLPENKERIFDLFVSLRDAEHRKSDSLGLGLYLVKLIAESHGGRVQATDLQSTTGAVFTVTFPLVETEEDYCSIKQP